MSSQVKLKLPKKAAGAEEEASLRPHRGKVVCCHAASEREERVIDSKVCEDMNQTSSVLLNMHQMQ